MLQTEPQTVALACHPSSPSTAVRGITASARIGGAGKLAVRFVLECDYFNGRTIDVDGGLAM